MTQKPTRYPALTARLIDEFLDSEWSPRKEK
jgi:hypothetical protein